jgi:hypothetical protein
MRELRFQYRLAIWLPWLLYVVHALFYADWIVDDAGISLAYARSAAEGAGLVSQPGRVPTEAYSNPLWVFLLSIWMWLGWFSLYLTPKLLAALCVLGIYAVLGISLRNHHGLAPKHIGLVLCLLSLNAPFVAWLNCGLENPLYALLIATQIWLSLRMLRAPLTRTLLLSGVVAGGLVMVRPDGMLFSLFVPMGLLLDRVSLNRRVDHLALWGIGWLLTAGAYLGIRKSYFASVLPTAFLAKPSLELLWLLDPLKWHHLFRAVVGPLGGVLALLLLGVIGWLLYHGHLPRQTVIWLVHFGGAVLVFLLLPYDHLGWYRYATPFVLLAYPVGALLLMSLAPHLPETWRMPSVRMSMLALWLVGTASLGAWVTVKRAQDPPVPLAKVRTRYVLPIEFMAEALNLQHYSVLLPDAGAPLWYGKGRVYDCLGLLDTTLALSFNRDTARYRQRVLEELQPTFIALHGPWVEEVALLDAPTFERDYFRIAASYDPDTLSGPTPTLYARKEQVVRPLAEAAWRRFCQKQGWRCQ